MAGWDAQMAYSLDFVDPEGDTAENNSLEPYSIDDADDSNSFMAYTVDDDEPQNGDTSLTPYSIDNEPISPPNSLTPYSIDVEEEEQQQQPIKVTTFANSIEKQAPNTTTTKQCKLPPGRTRSENTQQHAKIEPSELTEEEESTGYKDSVLPNIVKRTSSMTALPINSVSDPSVLFRSVFDPANQSDSTPTKYDGAQPRFDFSFPYWDYLDINYFYFFFWNRNWNNEFQSLLDKEPTRERTIALRDLAHDFVHASKKYGKIIIAEKNLPDDMKTIKRLGDSGGSAGGIKVCFIFLLFFFCFFFFVIY